jgi:hypothetical protein
MPTRKAIGSIPMALKIQLTFSFFRVTAADYLERVAVCPTRGEVALFPRDYYDHQVKISLVSVYRSSG